MQLFQSVQILQSLKMALLHLHQLQLRLRPLPLHQLRLLLHLLLLLHQLLRLPLHPLQVERLLQCQRSVKALAKELLRVGLRMWAIALQ
jgi:hypothetical protein